MNMAEIAKQICQDFGIEWDEKASVATLNGEPMDSSAVFSCFFNNVVFSVPNMTEGQEYPMTEPKALLAA